MRIIGPGQIAVGPNESITVQILKSKAPYKASVSDLSGAAWSPAPQTVGLSANGGFVAPQNQGTIVRFGILFDFIPDQSGDSPGDFYQVAIQGSQGGDTFSQTIFPPGFSTRDYQLTVS